MRSNASCIMATRSPPSGQTHTSVKTLLAGGNKLISFSYVLKDSPEVVLLSIFKVFLGNLPGHCVSVAPSVDCDGMITRWERWQGNGDLAIGPCGNICGDISDGNSLITRCRGSKTAAIYLQCLPSCKEMYLSFQFHTVSILDFKRLHCLLSEKLL